MTQKVSFLSRFFSPFSELSQLLIIRCYQTDALLDQLSSESHRARNEAGTEGGFFGKENLERGMELDRSGEGWGQGVLLGASSKSDLLGGHWAPIDQAWVQL